MQKQESLRCHNRKTRVTYDAIKKKHSSVRCQCKKWSFIGCHERKKWSFMGCHNRKTSGTYDAIQRKHEFHRMS